jgi:ATP phosphoribosyltransferase regulatory subunit HisZ
MILEHEIPSGSKLYFGNSAKVKREIEKIASDILYSKGFEEIVTPIFSYHQHTSIADERELIKVNDENNNSISLRADSTIDVVRIIEKRLGRNTEHKKWFYIQPVFRYPTDEQFQIGVEFMGESKLSTVLNIAIDIFDTLEIEPLIQISNMMIPKLLVEIFKELTLDDFKYVNIEKFLGLNVEWLEKLVYLQYPEQISELLEIVPEELKIELIKMKNLAVALSCKKTVLAPMYYAKMLYYDELFFRVIEKNEVYARGGRYKNAELSSVGFAIYTDLLIETKAK